MKSLADLFWALLGDNHGETKHVPSAVVVLPLLLVAIAFLVVIVALNTTFTIITRPYRRND